MIRALAVFRKLFLPVADQLAQYWIARTDLRTLTNPALAKLGRGTPDREGTYIANGLAGPPAPGGSLASSQISFLIFECGCSHENHAPGEYPANNQAGNCRGSPPSIGTVEVS